MEDTKFENFFNKYFTTTETKITMEIYETLSEFKNKWKNMNNEELDKRINVFFTMENDER